MGQEFQGTLTWTAMTFHPGLDFRIRVIPPMWKREQQESLGRNDLSGWKKTRKQSTCTWKSLKQAYEETKTVRHQEIGCILKNLDEGEADMRDKKQTDRNKEC